MARRSKTKRRPLTPGCEGKRELKPEQTENPYRKGEMETVVRNIRESSLSTMRARRQLDDAQYLAGDWIRRKIEQTYMSSGTIDPSNEPVDRSGHADPLTDRVIEASQAIAKARAHIGAVAWPLLELICGQGMSIAEAAHRRYGVATEAQAKYVGRLFRDNLDEMAAYLGYASPRRVA